MHELRMVPLKAVIVISVLSLLLGLVSLHLLWPLIIFLSLAAVGLWDLRQPEYSLLRNYSFCRDSINKWWYFILF